jgi:NADPH:quinone reductase-like Zn-dependent oxidoreductase
MTEAQTLWTVSAGQLGLKSGQLGQLAPGHLRCRALYSAVSRGTESLVFSGKVPESEWQRMRAPLQRGDFPFPVAYGYQMVAEVLEGPLASGTRIFALHPHQDIFDLPAAFANILPAALPSRRAVLAANMETALNALWDSGAGPGDRIGVVGGGVVGLLVAFLAAGLPGAEVTLVDTDPSRDALATEFGAQFARAGQILPADCDVVFHCSASAAGLETCFGMAGLESSIIELSWYGDGTVPAALGGAFHARRLRLTASQVGHVSPSRRPRWDYARRIAKALHLLMDDRCDALLESDIPFRETPERLPRILAKPGALAQVIRY